MHSLTDLNNYSNQSVTFTDERATMIAYDTQATGTIYSRTMTEGQDLDTVVGANITTVINPTAALEYQIDMSAAPGSVLVWENFPDELTHTVTNDVHVIGNIVSGKLWDQVSNFTVDVNADFYKNNWAYTSSITYGGIPQRTWFNYFDMTTDLPELTIPTTIAYNANVSANTSVISYPQIIDTNNPSTSSYTLEVGYGDWYTYVYSGTGKFTTTSAIGGTSVWDPSNRKLTLTGTRAEINDHLANMTFTCLDPYSLRQTNDPLPDADSADAFDIEYKLTNPSGLVTRVYQHFRNSIASPISTAFTGNIDPINEYTFTNAMGIPKFNMGVDPNNYWIYYTLTVTGAKVIYPATATAVEFQSQSESGFTVRSWVDGSPTASRVAINDFIDALVLVPLSGVTNVRYQVIMSGLDENYWRNDLQIRNVAVVPSYVSKMPGMAGYLNYYKNSSTKFCSHVKLADYYPDAIHTVIITANIGTLSLDGMVDANSVTMQGNITAINNYFANVAYYPPVDYTGNVAVNITRSRDGVAKENIDNTLYYNAAAVSSPGITTMTITSNSTVPVNLDQRKYLKFDVVVVGGGGAIGRATGYNNGQGGGAGGNVAYWSNATTTSNAMVVTIGAPGQLVTDVGGDAQLRNGGETTVSWPAANVTVIAGGGSGGGNGATSDSYAGGDSRLAVKNGTEDWTTNVNYGGGSVLANVNFIWGGGGAGAGGWGNAHVSGGYGGLGGSGWTNPITNTVVSRGGTGFYANTLMPAGYGNGGYTHTISADVVAPSSGVVLIKYHV